MPFIIYTKITGRSLKWSTPFKIVFLSIKIYKTEFQTELKTHLSLMKLALQIRVSVLVAPERSISKYKILLGAEKNKRWIKYLKLLVIRKASNSYNKY